MALIIEAARTEVTDEANSQLERIQQEKKMWEHKYEQKRRQLKDSEQSHGK